MHKLQMYILRNYCKINIYVLTIQVNDITSEASLHFFFFFGFSPH